MTPPDKGNKLVATVTLLVAMSAVLFHLYTAGFSPMTALIQRPVHLGLMAALGFLGLNLRVRATDEPPSSPTKKFLTAAVAGLLLAGAVFSCAYLVVQQETLIRRAGSASAMDLVAGTIAIVVVLELARRTSGWGLVTVALLALGYAFLGPYMPGPFAHRGYGFSRLVQHLYLSTEGIWGVPLGVSADFVYLFVLFGVVLEAAGGGELLIVLAGKVAGRTRGGPAKTATVASAIMGSLSGSAVANVVTTGSLTIPMMKRTGFKAHFAAAIEAAASTGGQLMPPIMGAGAFILATWTNIPYVQVAAAAVVPAVLYYVALIAAVHFRAERDRLPRASEAPSGAIASRVHLLLPLGVIVVLLAMGRSPMRAAFWGVAAAAAATLMRKTSRLDWRAVRHVMLAAGSGTVQVAAACAAAGIVVGVASLTGIGLRMSELIVTLSGGHLPIALGLTALGSMVLGMGLPTTAAYVVLAALGAPALTQLGVPLLAAHLFIFYFGCMSNVTPPVSLAAYAGAAIARAPLMRTAVTAMGLAGAGFIVPFMFVYDPALLLAASPTEVVISGVTGMLGLTALAASLVGFGSRLLTGWERLAMGVGAMGLLTPILAADVAGAVVVVYLLTARKGGAGGGGRVPTVT
ncbi:MAG: TRAP transporter fused permease subunit [Gemmatimonadetes bacterium]|nr:TRAP transporter fused permease subunit [Gemmatimonadota bacterium]